MKIVDTAGQEYYKSISQQYYKQADGCLLVYDIANRNSFNEVKNYYKDQIKENCKADIKVILLGNKSDLKEERAVDSEEGASFAAENGYMFMETSCIKNEYVANSFEALIEIIGREAKEKNQTNRNEKSIVIDKNLQKKKSKGSSC